jgi:CheY-like chemotaxis protein
MRPKQLNILLADDDADDCLFFEEAISELVPPTTFTAVHDGEQLMKLLSNKINKLPNVIFLDLNMPRKNGFECLTEIKKNKALKDLPVVIFSTSFEQEVVNQLYQNGAHFFIRKPSEFSLFKKIILYAITLMKENNNSQPSSEDFILTVENSFTV